GECLHRYCVALLSFRGLFGGFVHALVAFIRSGHVHFNGDNCAFFIMIIHLQVYRGGDRTECCQGWASQNAIVW
ncbi:hypothetical protein A2U01_0061117, partial [Trifolium medium]|nr:hypothetical protein [Trifolium medium]